ncbi:MAG: hypothetical protein IID37_10635 [Planctomycetes bacterium]|nr:hypothetical protein [Planctomycetota bacterium]
MIAVGAHDHNHFGDVDESGAVYIYRYDGTNWIEEAELRASDPQEYAEFGHGVAVSLDGNVVVVGAPFPHVHNGADGAAYVFRFNGEEWVEEAKLEPSDGSGDDVFCENPAINGDVIICGAHKHFHEGVDSGSAYVFRFNGTEWIEDMELLAFDGEHGDAFGYASAVIGDTVLVGAMMDNNEYGNVAGAIYVYSLCPDDQVPCEGDANEDGIVDPLDAGFVLARFGCPVGTGDPSCDAADQNGDGIVDPLDSGFVLARFGECP